MGKLDNSHIGLGPILNRPHLNLTNHFCHDFIFKQGWILRHWSLGLQHVDLGGCLTLISFFMFFPTVVNIYFRMFSKINIYLNNNIHIFIGINNLRYVDDTTLMAESEEELKSLLMRVKEESERVSLRLNIKKTKFMASSPITAWQIEGEKVEVVTDFLFLGSKITVDSDCSHEIRRRLLLGRKAMTNLDSVLKNGDITLLTKVHIVKAVVFPVVTHSCESWTIKKAECQRIDAFELWYWRRLLKVPWIARRSKQSIFKGDQPWIFTGRTDAEPEAPVFWPSDANSGR